MPSSGLGWQPSRFLTDRTEAEHAFQLAERLGSINAAAADLGTTWPSLGKAFTRHGLGMPTRNPEAIRHRAIAAARQRTGQPATPPLDPGVCGAQPWRPPGPRAVTGRAIPVRPPRGAVRHRGANVVVELYSESQARKPTTRAWAIIRRADRSHRLAGQRASRSDRRHTDRAGRTVRSPSWEREMQGRDR